MLYIYIYIYYLLKIHVLKMIHYFLFKKKTVVYFRNKSYSEILVISFSSKYHNYVMCTTQLRTLCNRLDRLVVPSPGVYYMRDGPEVSYT